MTEYVARLNATKSEYPFKQWAEGGIDAYTPAVCAAFAGIFDKLIAELASKGEDASEEEKLASFREAVLALNALDEDDPGLIETGEREDLCELCNVVAVAAGLDPSRYGDGEGPASEWREW